MNPNEQIQESYERIARIAHSAHKRPPTTIIMNLAFFSEWYYWCEQNEQEHTHWQDKQIIVDERGIFPIAWSYHPNQQKVT